MVPRLEPTVGSRRNVSDDLEIDQRFCWRSVIIKINVILKHAR